MRRIRFGAEFRLRCGLAIEFVGHRKYGKAQRSVRVTIMNAVRSISRSAHRQVRLKELSAVGDECRV